MDVDQRAHLVRRAPQVRLVDRQPGRGPAQFIADETQRVEAESGHACRRDRV
jgi:hypothetical protein